MSLFPIEMLAEKSRIKKLSMIEGVQNTLCGERQITHKPPAHQCRLISGMGV